MYHTSHIQVQHTHNTSHAITYHSVQLKQTPHTYKPLMYMYVTHHTYHEYTSHIFHLNTYSIHHTQCDHIPHTCTICMHIRHPCIILNTWIAHTTHTPCIGISHNRYTSWINHTCIHMPHTYPHTGHSKPYMHAYTSLANHKSIWVLHTETHDCPFSHLSLL